MAFLTDLATNATTHNMTIVIYSANDDAASGIGPWPYPHLAALIRLDKWSKGDKSGPAQAIQGHSIS